VLRINQKPPSWNKKFQAGTKKTRVQGAFDSWKKKERIYLSLMKYSLRQGVG
jgi:hypothetical protein